MGSLGCMGGLALRLHPSTEVHHVHVDAKFFGCGFNPVRDQSHLA